jgi:hypothetical protein
VSSASHVIAKFGGQSALARLIGKGASTVQYWMRVGTIPAKWQERLLRLARERGIDLAPGDFVEPPTSGTDMGDEPRLPEARWPGVLEIGESQLPVYVLDDGRRVVSRTGAVSALVGPVGGNLESYLKVEALRSYVPANLSSQMVQFTIPGVVNKTVQGMNAETFLDVCRAYVRARDDAVLKTPRQIEIAIKAGMFLAACANVGLIGLIDEATGYQYERAQDALRLKLQLFLEDEMRKWEKTFPDELWKEFGRLTNWSGLLHERPKYWGKLVMELVYGYLDPDVADWLRKNTPKPQHGQNYHQWLSSQYGLKKLIEHLWMLIGMASACSSMAELRRKMGERYGRVPVQFTMFLPSPDAVPPALPAATRRKSARSEDDVEQAALPLG